MRIYNNERPAVWPAAGAVMSAVRVYPASGIPTVSQAHQILAPVSTSVERLLALAPAANQGTSGFAGEGIPAAKKGTDVRGVPPRGRPV